MQVAGGRHSALGAMISSNPNGYQDRLLAAVDRACAVSADGWAYAREVALAFEPGPVSISGIGQRLSAARTRGLVLCRPGAKGRLQWQCA